MNAHSSLAATAIGLTAALLLTQVGDAAAATLLRVRTISNQVDSISEFRPRIAGDSIVWQRGTGNSAEVMRWNGVQGVSLTANGVPDANPETDGIHVVWQQGSVGQRDIAVYDLVTRTTTFLSSPGDEVFPVISGIFVAWVELVDADGEVFIDPGPFGNQLTGNMLVESSLAFSGPNLVWSEGDDIAQTPGTGDDSHDIAVWNTELEGLFILSGTGTDDIRPVIAGDTVVWQAGPDGSGDIWYGNSTGTSNPLFQGSDERNPSTDGARVIWEHFDGLDFDLFLVDLASPSSVVQVTTDGIDDVTPQIEGNTMVWVKQPTPGDSEIWYAWEGGDPQLLPITRGNGRDDVRPRLGDGEFVFESCIDLGEPGELCDIVLAPEPRATALVAVALATLGALASRSARRAVTLAQLPKPR